VLDRNRGVKEVIGSAYLESRILSADPIELVAILYEHALLYTGQARECLAKRDILGRTAKIGRVVAILGELDGSLNHAAGGDFSTNLARLYQYMRERLLTANLRQQDEPLAEVEQLLTTLAEAWDGMPRTNNTVERKSAAPEPQAPVWQADAWQMSSTFNSQAWTA
jgi:flagellar protein FliS